MPVDQFRNIFDLFFKFLAVLFGEAIHVSFLRLNMIGLCIRFGASSYSDDGTTSRLIFFIQTR